MMFNIQYFKYLIKKHSRYIMLFFLISFIALPFLQITQLSKIQNPSYNLEVLYVISMILGFIISFIVPLFLFSFMQNKKSSDLYFSLPITRESLFITTSTFGLVVSLLPILTNYLISALLVRGSLYELVIYSCIITFCMIVSYIIALFASTQANNVVDSVIIAGAYHIVPCIVTVSLIVFFDNVANNFMLGSGNYASLFNNMIYYLSLPGFSTYILSYNTGAMTIGCWWTVLSVVLVYFAYRIFLCRKAENASERTKSIVGYPLIIVTFIASLAFAIYSTQFDWVSYVTLFIFYMIAYSFSTRKISFNYKILVSYTLIIVASITLAFTTERTRGFGLMHEQMDYPSSSKWQVHIDTPTTIGGFEDIKQEWNYLNIDTLKSSDTNALQKYQNDLINILDKQTKTESSEEDIFVNMSVNNQSRYYKINRENIDAFRSATNQLIAATKHNNHIEITDHNYNNEKSIDE